MLKTNTLSWEVVPGYDLEMVDWWIIWIVLGVFAVIALAIALPIYFLGWHRMSKEERANYKETKRQLKALKGAERKGFIASQPNGTRVMLKWRKASVIVSPIFVVFLVISSLATPILYTFAPQIYATLFYKDNLVTNEATKLAAGEAVENVVEIERQGIVLMRNDSKTLPLDTSTAEGKKINVFGAGAFGMFLGGGGSGEFATNYDYSNGHSVHSVKFEDALKEQGFEINPYLYNLAKNYSKNKTQSVADVDYDMRAAIATFGTTGRYEGISKKWLPYEHEAPVAAYEKSYTETNGKSLIEYSKEYSDTAIFCISRYGTEQYDLPFTSKDELKLTNEEFGMLAMLKENFGKVIVLLNTPGPMYLQDFEDLEIDTLLYVGLPGLTGTKAIAETLAGKNNPSGRLVDTWARDLTTNPTYETFGRKSTSYNAGGKTYPFSNYYEGIYVGYRYYTTRALADSSFNYNDYVGYSFGHGLSYTNFNTSLMKSEYDAETGKIAMTVSVKNIGERKGRHVIEIYSSLPYTDYDKLNGIEKSARNLVAYQKTNELEAGATENYKLEFNIRDLASWDKKEQCYNLEAGDYELAVRDNAWDIAVDSINHKENIYTIPLSEGILYRTSQTGKAYSNLFQDVERGGSTDPITYLSRKDFEGTYTKNSEVNRTWGGSAIEVDNNKLNDIKYTDNQIEHNIKTGVTLDTKITLHDMKDAEWDDERWTDFLSQLSINDMKLLVGASNDHSFAIPAVATIEKDKTSEGDGPASCYNSGTGHPNGTILASTWNNDAAELFGKSCAKEGAARGMTGWYAPGMNIHRSPYAGRNFEYYSEDPLISGNMGGYVAKGANEYGIYTFSKHFGLNEQEQNRNGINIWCSEQGMREVYLKPFEIYSNLGGYGLMSAFSSVGTTWAGASEALCTKLLRDEWGFHGSVITDYNNSSMPCAAGLRAGNDEWLIPATAGAGNLDGAVNATPNDMVYYLNRASKNILFSLAHSNAAWDDADYKAKGIINPRA